VPTEKVFYWRLYFLTSTFQSKKTKAAAKASGEDLTDDDEVSEDGILCYLDAI
jgi:hypothetical protein